MESPYLSPHSLHDFMKTLDELSATGPIPTATGAASTGPTNGSLSPAAATSLPPDQNAQSVLDFLDEITQRSSTPTVPVPAPAPSAITRQGSRGSMRGTTVPIPRKSGDYARPSAPSPVPSTSGPTRTEPLKRESGSPPVEPAANGGGWGWSSVWNSASSAIQQAKTVAEEVRRLTWLVLAV